MGIWTQIVAQTVQSLLLSWQLYLIFTCLCQPQITVSFICYWITIHFKKIAIQKTAQSCFTPYSDTSIICPISASSVKELILTHRLICCQNAFPRGYNAQGNFMQLLLLFCGKGGELVCHFDGLYWSTKKRKLIYELVSLGNDAIT